MTDTTPADRLRAALTHSDASARLQAALAAGTRPDDSYIAELVGPLRGRARLLRARHAHVGAHAARPTTAVAELLPEVASEVPQARSQALHTLSKIGDPAAFAGSRRRCCATGTRGRAGGLAHGIWARSDDAHEALARRARHPIRTRRPRHPAEPEPRVRGDRTPRRTRRRAGGGLALRRRERARAGDGDRHARPPTPNLPRPSSKRGAWWRSGHCPTRTDRRGVLDSERGVSEGERPRCSCRGRCFACTGIRRDSPVFTLPPSVLLLRRQEDLPAIFLASARFVRRSMNASQEFAKRDAQDDLECRPRDHVCHRWGNCCTS